MMRGRTEGSRWLGFVLALAGIVALLIGWRLDARRAARRLSELETTISRLEVENQRLTALAGEARRPETRAEDGAAELLRLRARVSELGRQLAAQTSGVPAVTAESGTSRPEQGSAGAPAIPREAWAFSGYQTPESALQTVAWAMNTGDVKVFLDSLTAEAKAAMAQEFKDKTEEELGRHLREEIQAVGALRPDRIRGASEDEASFVLTSMEKDDGQIVARDEAILKFQRVAGQWKLTGF